MLQILNCPICNSLITKNHIKCVDHTATQEEFNLMLCEKCDFCITTPRPNNLDKYYISKEYISHSSKATNIIDQVYLLARKFTLRNKFNLVQKQITNNGTPALLDVGCGTGEFLKYSKNKNWSITGVEPTAKAFSIASEITSQIYTSLEEITQNQFDSITLWHVLEHIPDLNSTLQSLKEKLKDNGTIFIAVPNFKSYDAIYYNYIWAGYDVPRHLWHFSQQSMQNLINNNGLALKETIPMKLDSYYVSLLSEKYSNENKINLSAILKATLNGFKSNRKAKHNGEYSSLIYVIKK